MASDGDTRIRTVVSSVVAARGLDLEDLRVLAAGQRRSIRVVVDRDGGADLDLIAEVSRDVAAALDEQGEAIFRGAAYTLEVTSRGVGSPLTEPRHFRRSRGRLVAFTLHDGSRRIGRILQVTDASVVVLGGKDGLTESSIGLADIARATVEVEFSAPPPAVQARLAAVATPPSETMSGTTEGEDAR